MIFFFQTRQFRTKKLKSIFLFFILPKLFTYHFFFFLFLFQVYLWINDFQIEVLTFPVEIVHCTRSDTGSVRWRPCLFVFSIFIFRLVINYFNWWKAQWQWSEIRKKSKSYFREVQLNNNTYNESIMWVLCNVACTMKRNQKPK